MRRTPLRRITPLRASKPVVRSTPLRKRRAHPRGRGELEDPDYLAWIRAQPCRVTGCQNHSEAHHLRHTETGAAMGAHVKDDRRAISLCHYHHITWLHQMPWVLRAEVKCELRAWQDSQLALQRAEYLRRLGGSVDFPA